VYDFENHVIQAGSGITIVYDGDGNRVKKTVAGVTTTWRVPKLMLTASEWAYPLTVRAGKLVTLCGAENRDSHGFRSRIRPMSAAQRLDNGISNMMGSSSF